MQRTLRPFTVALALAAPLVGCTSARDSADNFPAPFIGDEGILVAESQMVPGITGAASITGTTDDCGGPGLGVMVGGSVSSGKYLYDSNGEPCDASVTIFDGRTKVDSRPADPGIALTFHDAIGPLPTATGDIPRIDTSIAPLKVKPPVPATEKVKPGTPGSEVGSPKVTTAEPPAQVAPAQDAALPEKRVVAEAPAPKPDPLMSTLTTWQKQDGVTSARAQEAADAASRNLENIAKEQRSTQEQETIAQLSARLRERERQIQEEQRRQAETLERAEKSRQQTAAAKQNWSQRESELQNELDATQQRLKQFENLNNRLQQQKTEKEQVYQSKIIGLTTDLKAAQAQADLSRRDLIIQAAAKIAEAEKLAAAAAMQEQDAQLREATRLKQEADRMMDQALAIQNGQPAAASNLENISPAAGNLPLEAAPVTIHAKNQTLEQLLANVLTQASAQAGPWKSDWQLSAKAQYILKEKWSLTAEAPVQQVLDQLATQVKDAHNITLTFSQFSQSRLLVVTDTPSNSKKVAPAAK